MLRASIFLNKGGTGKTTSTAHIGVALTEQNIDVLLIDLAGKQADLAKQFGLYDELQSAIANDDDWPNISTVFQEQWSSIVDQLGPTAITDLILETDEGVDLLPAHPGLDGLDSQLTQVDDAMDRYTRLDRFLTEYIEPEGYDAVLLDLPGLANNITYNGLFATKQVVAPVEMGPFEAGQARELQKDLATITENFDITISLAMVLLNKVDQRTNLASEYLERYEAEYPDILAPMPVPVSQDIRNALDNGETIFALTDPSRTAKQAIEAYRAAATELSTRLQQ